ncbi:hypothetical protein [Rhodococcus jostii]|uniref:hypothetical protein n=1 Tax=Rhodococcus jostii TaxID=132919 RepID=UPI0011600700|nr:hypothetical protein [Rhodococcus jostii]
MDANSKLIGADVGDGGASPSGWELTPWAVVVTGFVRSEGPDREQSPRGPVMASRGVEESGTGRPSRTTTSKGGRIPAEVDLAPSDAS